jgi:hypothetical protein
MSKSFQVCRVVDSMNTVLWDATLCSCMDSFPCCGVMILKMRQCIPLECQCAHTMSVVVIFQEIIILNETGFARLHHYRILGHTKSCPFSCHFLFELFAVSLNCLHSKVFWVYTVFKYRINSVRGAMLVKWL